MKKLVVAMAAAAAGAAPLASQAAVLEGVNYEVNDRGQTEVRLKFNEAPPAPSGYVVEHPARIALDFADSSSNIDSRKVDMNIQKTQSMTIVEAKDRMRLIFNLFELDPHTTRVEGNDLVVAIGEEQAVKAVGKAVKEVPAKSRAPLTKLEKVIAAEPSQVSINNIDFRREGDQKGLVELTLADEGLTVSLTETGNKIVLRIPESKVPSKHRRRLNVEDFATPVSTIESFQDGQDSVIVIKPDTDFEYAAYQTRDKFYVAIEKSENQSVVAEQEGKKYTGRPLSLNFQEIEIRTVLQIIADFTDMNLVTSDTVSGTITLRLNNTPWDQALDLVLKTKGLDKRMDGNVMLVAPAEEIAAREKVQMENQKQLADMAPVKLEIIQVNYAKAEDIVNMINNDENLLSERGYVSSDERTNTISIRDTAENRDEVRQMIKTWDIPVRQVAIEARIVRAQTNVSKKLGARFGGGAVKFDGANGNAYSVGGGLGTQSEIRTSVSNGSPALSFPEGLAVDLGVSDGGASSFAVGIAGSDFLLDLELSALESDGMVELVSQPKVVTADRKTASIRSGEEIPYQEASSSGATSVSFKEAALSLEVTPQITPDNKIIMDLKVNQDSRGEVTAGIPSINTNSVETQVLVGDGETVVLGGVFQSEQAEQVTKTPLLGDIPFIGRLFKRTEVIDERSELLIFIRPIIMKPTLID